MANRTVESVDREIVVTEVLELGEVLFDEVIKAAAKRPGESDEDEAFPVEEVRAAADEFFRALRLLLGTDSAL
jgi:hypothetical protein